MFLRWTVQGHKLRADMILNNFNFKILLGTQKNVTVEDGKLKTTSKL